MGEVTIKAGTDLKQTNKKKAKKSERGPTER